jgi:hypothetical protein
MEGARLVGGCCGNSDGLEREDEIYAAVELPLPRSTGEPLILGDLVGRP